MRVQREMGRWDCSAPESARGGGIYQAASLALTVLRGRRGVYSPQHQSLSAAGSYSCSPSEVARDVKGFTPPPGLQSLPEKRDFPTERIQSKNSDKTREKAKVMSVSGRAWALGVRGGGEKECVCVWEGGREDLGSFIS